MLWVFGLVLNWHDNSELSPLGNASAKFPDQTDFQSWTVNFQVEVCAKAKNLALVLQWIKRSKQPAHWRTSSIHNQLREKISLIMKNWIWWWRQDWNGATMFFVWSTKLPSVEPWQDKRAKNSHTERKTRRMFSAENKWVLFKKGTLVVFYTSMPRETVRTAWNEVEICKKFSSRSKHPLQYRKWKTQTDGKKLEQSKGQSCDKSWKFLVYGGQDEKHRRVIINIIPCVVVTSLETDAFMAIVAYIDVLKVRRNLSARSRQEGTQGTVAVLKTKRPRSCISRLGSNEYCSVESWRIGIERFCGTHLKFSGCIWYKIEFGKGKGNLEALSRKGELHERNFCALGFEGQPREETSRQADCTSKVAWNLARKYASSSRTSNYVFYFLVKAPETQKRVCLLCYSGASMHNAEQGYFSSDTIDTLRRSKNTICDLPRPGTVQINE